MTVKSLIVAAAVVVMIAMSSAVARAATPAQRELQAALRARPNLANGEEAYAICSACHGVNGEGVSDGTIPAIAGQHFSVLVKQLVDFRHNRRWDIRMEHFADERHLTDAQQLADVAAFVNALRRPLTVGVGSGEYLARGTGVYFRLCASCHGPVGQGDAARRIPALAGQHAAYLVRQMHDSADNRRPNMAGAHAQLVRRSLVFEDIMGVADYLSRLQLSSAPRPVQAAHARRPSAHRSDRR